MMLVSDLLRLRVDQVHAALQAAIPFFSITAVAAGLAALIIPLFRRNLRRPSIFYFGAFSSLYSLRVLIQCHFRELPPGSIWALSNFVFGFVDGIPALLFVREFLEGRRRAAMLWFVGAFGLLSAVAIPAYFFDMGVRAAWYALDGLGIISVAGVIALTSFRSQAMSWEVRTLRLGWVVFGLYVVTTNLSYLGVIHGTGDLEPIGVLSIVSFPAYVVVRSLLRDHDRLLSVESELEIARQIQNSLLPHEMPQVPGLEIAGRYVPATEVAGDFYDFLVMDEARLGVLIADVSGHGVPAALVASMVKVALAAQTHHASDPARVLAGLNQVLCGKLRDDQFVTAMYLFLDSGAGGACYASAGHPELLVRQSCDKQIMGFPATGAVLGIWPDAQYGVTHIPMKAGDRCVLYTDGIVEASNRVGELFGTVRLKQFVEKYEDVPAARMSDLLLQAVSAWSAKNGDGAQQDDQTLLVIDCVP